VTSRADFYRDSADAQALEQAVNLAAKNPLPLTARSLSAEEIAAIDHRIYPIVFGIYAVGAIGILLFARFGTEGEAGLFPIAAIVALVLLVPLWLFARFKAERRKAYRDPLQSVEASVDGVTIRDAGRTARIAYGEVAVAEVILLSGAKSRVLFLGVALDGPFGPVRLENMAYKHGTLAAAAIVAQRHALGLPLVRRDA
jgi:hypothetical protein